MLPTPFAEAVLDLVALVPRGRVVTYGDVAAALGQGGPRAVGTIMARYGGGVPWHRVVRADGSPAAGHEAQALTRLRAEGVPMRGDRVDLGLARWTGVSEAAASLAPTTTTPSPAEPSAEASAEVSGRGTARDRRRAEDAR